MPQSYLTPIQPFNYDEYGERAGLCGAPHFFSSAAGDIGDSLLVLLVVSDAFIYLPLIILRS